MAQGLLSTLLGGDLVKLFTGDMGPSSVADAARPPSLTLPLDAPLIQFAEGERFARIDRRESYFRKCQHDAKQYDWDGNFAGYSGEQPLPVGYVVPYGRRRPSARYDLASIIVRRFTALLFGQDHFPQIQIAGDEDAEAFVNALCREAKLASRMQEARDLGGATGTACLSFAFKGGKPALSVHNSKHCNVLDWSDEDERRPRAVLKTYSYRRRVFDIDAKRIREVTYYYARYWDETREVLWEPIPQRIAKLPQWADAPKVYDIEHGLGFCPFYWIQNAPDSIESDGEGDYEGLEGNFNQIDELVSASSSGTKANVDPTLVVHMDVNTVPTGGIRKGSQNAIFSPAGAEYLELKGQATKAAIDQAEFLRDITLDAADCVIPDPEKLSGNAQSGRAIQMLYAPMTARADILRGQYGDHGIIPIARDMLRAAKMILASQPEQLPEGTEAPDGARAVQPAIVLPKREVPVKKPPRPAPEMGERLLEEPPEAPETELVEHTPGESEEISLNWPPYFPVGWPDIAQAVTATMAANGGKPVISQKSGVKAVSTMFGVTDAEAELHEIEMDSEKAMDKDARKMAMMPPPPGSEPDGDEEPKPPGPPEKK